MPYNRTWSPDEATLSAPLNTRKSWRYRVVTDLFADFVTDETIDRVFAVMALCPQHTFQVLTKCSLRMREYLSDAETPFRVAQAMAATTGTPTGPEEFHAVDGFPGYLVSSHGHVYSDKRGKRKRLRPDAGEQGHLRVPLFREGGPRRGERILVHRLVLATFDGPPPTDDAQGRHLDGNPSHNAIDNLTWGDQSDNWQDSRAHGSFRRYSKLTDEQVAEIKGMSALGATAEGLARRFPVSATQIRNIVAGRQWNVEAPITWPLGNVWAGVSVEDQARADERIPDLLATPGAVRWLSCEPLLGPVDVRLGGPHEAVNPAYWGAYHARLRGLARPRGRDACRGWADADMTLRHHPDLCEAGQGIRWIVCGGESGKGARGSTGEVEAWMRSLRDQCAAAGVPFFFKQWGEWATVGRLYDEIGDTDETIAAETAMTDAMQTLRDGSLWIDPERLRLVSRGMSNWANEEAQPTPDALVIRRVGKKGAGRLLDGQLHDAMPERV